MIKIKNKILYILLALFIILALIYNANNFVGFFYNTLGNVYFKSDNFEKAIDYHTKSDEKLSNNTTKYNLGGDYYKLGDYKKSKEYFDQIKTETGKSEDLDMNYNLGNIYYKLGEKEQEIQNKVDLYKSSLLNYKNVLDKKKDKKTQENYDFVEKKLKDLEDKQDDKESQDKESSEQKDQGDSKDEDKEGGEEQDKNGNEKDGGKEGDKKQDPDSKEENTSEEGDKTEMKNNPTKNSLSSEEKRQLEEYNEQLKQEQKYNSNLFGKQEQGNSQDIFDIFNQDPFFGNSKNFDDSILNKNEKDW